MPFTTPPVAAESASEACRGRRRSTSYSF
uniref:Uncharacterized protein n=1 Tax=Rhizophora mucronata TaxID=61149 RepID=A0A2P2QMG5_RHIMU